MCHCDSFAVLTEAISIRLISTQSFSMEDAFISPYGFTFCGKSFICAFAKNVPQARFLYARLQIPSVFVRTIFQGYPFGVSLKNGPPEVPLAWRSRSSRLMGSLAVGKVSSALSLKTLPGALAIKKVLCETVG